MLAHRRGLALGTFLLTQLLPSTYKCQSTEEQTKLVTSPALLQQSAANIACNNNSTTLVTNPCMCGIINDREEIDVADALVTGSVVGCINGFSNTGSTSYPCNNINLMSHMPLSTLNSLPGSPQSDRANDCWGWTDSTSNREYAIIGLRSGTSFVDITDPINPIYVGMLPSRESSIWGDIKTYINHAFIVKESNEGIQIIDLSQLGSVSLGSILSETAHYTGFTNAHNIAINEESGFAYAVGTQTCDKGLHMIDIRNPSNPVFAGCFGDDGYTHDVQCVMYKGSHSEYVGKEICFAENADTVTIIDVTDKSNPSLLSRTNYTNMFYTHQGWLTEDHNYLIFGDEIDERNAGLKTTTYVLNVMNLVNPVLVGTHTALTDAIDHNQYVKGNFVYQANYRAGLRILEMNDMSSANFNEIAYFDIYPESDSANFNGAWSTYPYFDSGSIIVSGIEQGLFVLRGTWMTSSPSSNPSIVPSQNPSTSPSNVPSQYPSLSVSPTPIPTKLPTSPPSKRPTFAPTKQPTKAPTSTPTKTLTKVPTKTPTKVPTKTPTKVPTKTPTKVPTKTPTKVPTKTPTKVPTKTPTKVPTKTPTKAPTKTPTKVPTKIPTKAPTRTPTKNPTKHPTNIPTKHPTNVPTKPPTTMPTRAPTTNPTLSPTNDIGNTMIITLDDNARMKQVNGNLFYIKSKINMSINEIATYVQNKRSTSTSSKVMVYTTKGRNNSFNKNKYTKIKSTKLNVNRRKQQISFGKFNCPVSIKSDREQAFLLKTTGRFFAFKGDERIIIGENNDMKVINVASMIRKRNRKTKKLRGKEMMKKIIRKKKLMWAGSLSYTHSLSNKNCS